MRQSSEASSASNRDLAGDSAEVTLTGVYILRQEAQLCMVLNTVPTPGQLYSYEQYDGIQDDLYKHACQAAIQMSILQLH
ncbi:hypothetical protein NDU88_006794 [Pleurodeles waltl]|uniref:Uncharacterized protein n=1 Tax=Pleurodeles waltl TaxID=8319 RepID=A0AAV7NT01_PLEWA|nr:hypothetical protein NDU88_006794 [Pleurodeles waltl]